MLHRQWLDGIAFPKLANTKQKVLEVYVGRRGDMPILLDARGNFYSFDSQGVHNLGPAMQAMRALQAAIFGPTLSTLAQL